MGMAQEWLVYPKKWMSRYDSRGNFRVGPLVPHSRTSAMDASHTTLTSDTFGFEGASAGSKSMNHMQNITKYVA